MVDCCKVFDHQQKAQIPMDVLCEKYLAFNFRKKKNQPHAFTEAKIAMALFKKWQQIKGLHLTGPAQPVKIDELPEELELSGQQLQKFINLHV